jgi:DNA-binding SARP family transcriptional activator
MVNQANRELVQVLIEDPDPSTRSQAHRELARRAAQKDNIAKAMRHYREAAYLDPTDETSRDALKELEEQAGAQGTQRRRGVFRRLLRRMSRNRQ